MGCDSQNKLLGDDELYHDQRDSDPQKLQTCVSFMGELFTLDLLPVDMLGNLLDCLLEKRIPSNVPHVHAWSSPDSESSYPQHDVEVLKMSGEHCAIQPVQDDTAATLQAKLAEEMEVAPRHIRLVHQGVNLPMDLCLSELGGSTVHVIVEPPSRNPNQTFVECICILLEKVSGKLVTMDGIENVLAESVQFLHAVVEETPIRRGVISSKVHYRIQNCLSLHPLQCALQG